MIVGLCTGSLPVSAWSSPLEYLLMPGEVIEAHADIERQCDRCHVVGNQAAQPALCGDCHEEVLTDVASGQGFHGRLTDPECQLCHFEHHGRSAILAPLDTNDFDHTHTDFLLEGKHTDLTCDSCHDNTHKFAETSQECGVCHIDDDVHHNALSKACADCHVVSGWPGATLDHLAVAGFELRLSHGDVTCTTCHDQHNYDATPTTCDGCHADTDEEKGHKSLFGTKCEQCHEESTWDKPLFVHDRDTKFVLDGLHVPVACNACHPGKLFEVKTPIQCAGCHQEDDPHLGRLGETCAGCHSTGAWSSTHFQHDRDTSFGLYGRHQDAECAGCHEDATFQVSPPTLCVSCHLDDDTDRGHQGRFGEACDTCHKPDDWREAYFDHADTRFSLLGKHLNATCASCHRRETVGLPPQECVACHTGDDRHQQRLGLRCGQCHIPEDWSQVNFDHNQQSEYELVGAHAEIACIACHIEPVAGKLELPATCYDCHDDEDVHFGTLSDRCSACHKPTKWREVLPDAKAWLKSGGPPATGGKGGTRP